jgi:long-subunit acyl-CoA synthetase (AMP-forming)
VLEAGSKEDKENPSLPWNKCTENDFPIFSYTSGTTGDSKGVKLTHKNILSSA